MDSLNRFAAFLALAAAAGHNVRALAAFKGALALDFDVEDDAHPFWQLFESLQEIESESTRAYNYAQNRYAWNWRAWSVEQSDAAAQVMFAPEHRGHAPWLKPATTGAL